MQTFKHFDLKWRDYDSIHWQPLDSQAEPHLDAALREAAGKMFKAMGGVSYGRSDFRVDQQGMPGTQWPDGLARHGTPQSKRLVVQRVPPVHTITSLSAALSLPMAACSSQWLG